MSWGCFYRGYPRRKTYSKCRWSTSQAGAPDWIKSTSIHPLCIRTDAMWPTTLGPATRPRLPRQTAALQIVSLNWPVSHCAPILSLLSFSHEHHSSQAPASSFRFLHIPQNILKHLKYHSPFKLLLLGDLIQILPGSPGLLHWPLSPFTPTLTSHNVSSLPSSSPMLVHWALLPSSAL